MIFLLACASQDPHWAVNHLSLVPTEKGVEGTQTWEFFEKSWQKHRAEKTFVCVRAQSVTGTVVSPLEGCDDCRVAYTLESTDFDTDCASDVGNDSGFRASLSIAIGSAIPSDIAALDPYPGQSMAWYLAMDNETYEPWGFAYDEALDYDGELGRPGWVSDQYYTLWPAVALEL